MISEMSRSEKWLAGTIVGTVVIPVVFAAVSTVVMLFDAEWLKNAKSCRNSGSIYSEKPSRTYCGLQATGQWIGEHTPDFPMSKEQKVAQLSSHWKVNSLVGLEVSEKELIMQCEKEVIGSVNTENYGSNSDIKYAQYQSMKSCLSQNL